MAAAFIQAVLGFLGFLALATAVSRLEKHASRTEMDQSTDPKNGKREPIKHWLPLGAQPIEIAAYGRNIRKIMKPHALDPFKWRKEMQGVLKIDHTRIAFNEWIMDYGKISQIEIIYPFLRSPNGAKVLKMCCDGTTYQFLVSMTTELESTIPQDYHRTSSLYLRSWVYTVSFLLGMVFLSVGLGGHWSAFPLAFLFPALAGVLAYRRSLTLFR